ncbi:MAG: Serine/threonine-protein kinase PknB [Lentisphaerae bacterium ADurb.BinA184]|nr:MAG: Serine/threonine-protein kinase PknB [Lentisphaerae bacterium ADurb.BinA184]
MIARVVQKNLKITCPACDQKLDASEIPAFTRVNCPSCSAAIVVPCRFGQYLIEEPLGEDRLSGVYRALDLKLSREVALRILDADLAKHAEAVQAFVEAGRRIAVLTHAYIVPIYSSGDFEGLPFLVMEYMPGRSAADQMARTGAALPWPEAVGLCEKAARGLDAANREGMAHGGFTPRNILLGSERHVKVGDFGLTRFKRLSASHLGLPAEAVVCSPYSSPETWRAGAVDARADLYSLGAVLYHLLAGQAPFGADAAARLRTLGMLPARKPRDINSRTPARLNALCMKLMAPDPAARPASYREAIGELAALGEQAARTARPVKPAPGAGRGAGGGVAGKAPARGAGRAGSVDWAQRHRVRRAGRRTRRVFDVAILCSLLLLVVVFAAAAARRPQWYVRNIEPGVRWLRERLSLAFRNPVPEAAPPPERGEEEDGDDGVAIPSWRPMQANGTAPVETDWGRLPIPSAPPAGMEARPRPRDLDFSSVRAELDAYLQSQPAAFRPVESERVGMVRSARGYLVRLMQYVPYDGSDGIGLRNGGVVRGVAPYANERGISVRVKGGGAELVKIGWADLSFEQYLAMFQFYVNQRLGLSGVASGEGRIEGGHDAARDYLLMAVLCDWYGYPERARDYGERARRLDPRMEAPLKRMLAASDG